MPKPPARAQQPTGPRSLALGVTTAIMILLASPAPALADTADASDVSITAPREGFSASGPYPRFEGRGQDDASVIVRDAQGAVLCAARVQGGNWICGSVVPMGQGPATVTATQDSHGRISVDDRSITVGAVPKPFPLSRQQVLLVIGGGIVILGALATGIVVLVRRVRKRSRATVESFVIDSDDVGSAVPR
jgi:hypothetical protein